ncbi:putative hydro-lyase [Acuticoccus kandeliae]|uniref:putative hydro-lyase n=1 Tax=Acuticoccus kandeliae TaxID=2073160 RepID=UPI000D3E4305|nr:putative hydro-lyase [Acuticoccus kandeliae]
MDATPVAAPRNLSSVEVRAAIRAGEHRRHTAGLAPGKLQANLAIIPVRYALDFLRFCQRNPKPCPVVGITDTGDPVFRTLGTDIDVRTDVPRYRVFRDGELAGEVDDLTTLWRDDLVAVALGCSFTFERALAEAGIAVRHIDEDVTVPMFRTTIDCIPAGPFNGTMVVSMRPIPQNRVEETIEICRRYPLAHGAPVHVGDPEAIGIDDIAMPDFGEPVAVHAGEVPVFWACGVTPQIAILNAAPDLAITHAPGHMLITDVDEDSETPIAII